MKKYRFSEEANDPSLGKFSKLLKCMMREQSKEPGGMNNMDWSQWQSVAGSGQFPQKNWNSQQNRNQNPGWIRPGQQQPNWPPGQQQPGGQGQPRPGVHPDDWNSNNNRVPPPPPVAPPGGNNGWPPQPPQHPPPPPNGPPPGWGDDRIKNSNNDNNRRKNRRKQQNKNNFNPDDVPPVMIPSPDPSMGTGIMNVPGPTGPQWGTNVGAIEDPEMTKNRQFGYAIMACAVVALAVLMVSFFR